MFHVLPHPCQTHCIIKLLIHLLKVALQNVAVTYSNKSLWSAPDVFLPLLQMYARTLVIQNFGDLLYQKSQ